MGASFLNCFSVSPPSKPFHKCHPMKHNTITVVTSCIAKGGKEFFITGSTGFLAKVLVEKILRTVPDVGKIFVRIDRKRVDIIVNSALIQLLMKDMMLPGHKYKRCMPSHGFRQECKKLKLFLQVSTGKARKHGWQDTYVFTKAMGEMMINNMRGEIPVVIIRPSVIESTCKEPFPGWMEGNRMMDPVVLCYGKGQLTGFLVDPNGVLDVVPADMVVNATLAAIARHGMSSKPDIIVYHVASSVVNPGFPRSSQNAPRALQFVAFSRLEGHPDPQPDWEHWRPGAEVAAEARSRMQEVSGAGKYLANIYEPYTFYGGRFDNSNTKRLLETMSKKRS
ncbi:Fatty acyl-CoA reductase 2 [Hibiscus syriacus]|uniref:Fatty acyl-CoA reductase n=1 Tax=Hibiscus syriacus TaxID=106335 RepID=A0A6A2Y689_HIBSY|nr:Fatty acyl-CoA reductase 2 [Hibiscus syriacus]